MATFKLRSDTNSVRENGSTTGNVLLNDSLADQVLQIKAGSGVFEDVPSGGVTIQGIYGLLTIWQNGTYSYTSTEASDKLKAGSTASDTFTYTATSSSGSSGSTTLKFTVTGVNDAPVLPSDPVTFSTITEDQTTNSGRSVSSFLSSTDIDSSALRGIAITGLASGNGQWQYSIDGRTTWLSVGSVSDSSALLLRSSDYIRFVPNGENGTTANFTYHAWDQTSGSTGAKVNATTTGGGTAFSTGAATASITVTDVNDAPKAQTPLSASGAEDGPPITGQVHATDVDSTTLTYKYVANSAVGGSVSIDAATGNYSFTPAANFNGAASFEFTASDGSLTSAPGLVNIAIQSVNDDPVANTDNAGTYANTPVLIDVLANDTDIDGDTLSISAPGAPSHGSVQIQNGQLFYTPAAGYTGADAFIYTVSDGAGGADQGHVNVTVASVQSNVPVATTVTFSQGANGYTGAIDTMLKENVATTSYPTSFVLRSGLESGKDEQVLLKFGGLFGTGPGQIPVGAQIVSATLQLEATGASTDGGTLNRMLINWSDTSTWSSLGSGVQTDGVEATASGLAIGAVGLGTHVIDVTDSLLAWNAAATTSAGQNAANLGWLFNPTSTDIWDFSSSQGAVHPLLTITYTLQSSPPASLPAVSISAAAPAAENSGKITFNLSLSQAATQDVTVNFSTVDHTATAGSDYVATTQSLTFLAGQTSKSFDVSLINDTAGERLEDFTVQINSVTNAKIGAGVASGKIIDDDVVVPPMPALTPSVIHAYNIYDGTTYKDGSGQYGISDPSGLAYIPSLGRMFVADSEHDESPFFSPTNLFSLKLDGTYDTNYSLNSFSKEPTGLAYNPNNGYLYISDDDKYSVSWVSPTNPTVRLGSFDTRHLGYLDTEDLKIDPLTGHIHELDGTLKQMIELTDQGVFVNAVPLPSVMTDAEALAYDPLHDLYFVASGASKLIWILDAQGDIKATIDVFSSGYSGMKIKGMEYAPSSDPNDGNTMSLYVADYHTDQVNDGRLYEVHLGNDWWFA